MTAITSFTWYCGRCLAYIVREEKAIGLLIWKLSLFIDNIIVYAKEKILFLK